MKPRHWIMGAALAVAAGLVAFGDRGADDGIAEPAQRRAPAAVRPETPAGAPAAKGEVAIARLLPRDELIGDERDDGTAFQSQNWNPPPPPPPPPAPPPPPSAPALPFTVIGKALSNGVWEAYLSRNDQIYVVRPGDVLDGTYRIDSIAPPLMTLTYLPMNQVQQLNIGATE